MSITREDLKELQEQFDAIQVDMLECDLDFYDTMWPIAVESEGDVDMVMREAMDYCIASWKRYHDDPEALWYGFRGGLWRLLNTKATLEALVKRLRNVESGYEPHRLVEVWDLVFGKDRRENN